MLVALGELGATEAFALTTPLHTYTLQTVLDPKYLRYLRVLPRQRQLGGLVGTAYTDLQ